GWAHKRTGRRRRRAPAGPCRARQSGLWRGWCGARCSCRSLPRRVSGWSCRPRLAWRRRTMTGRQRGPMLGVLAAAGGLPMEFGYFTLSDNHYDNNHRTANQFVADITAEALVAETLGMHSAWIGEHHFNSLGVLSCP